MDFVSWCLCSNVYCLFSFITGVSIDFEGVPVLSTVNVLHMRKQTQHISAYVTYLKG